MNWQRLEHIIGPRAAMRVRREMPGVRVTIPEAVSISEVKERRARRARALLAKGYSRKQIRERLGLSRFTVWRYLL